MAIDATNPTVIPARDEATYPHWYIVGLILNGRDKHPEHARQMVNGVATLAKCRFLADGSVEFSPSGEAVDVPIGDIMGLAAEDSEVAEWLALSISLIVNRATAQGLL